MPAQGLNGGKDPSGRIRRFQIEVRVHMFHIPGECSREPTHKIVAMIALGPLIVIADNPRAGPGR